MNSLFSILLKNLILLALIVISLVFVFTNNIGYKEIQVIFLSMGSVYVLSACFEAYKLSQTKPGTKKFIYFPDGFVAKRFLKVIAFVASGVVLYVSKKIAKIEARHGLTYFVNHNKNSITVRTDMMKESAEFKIALENWISDNNLQDKVVLL